MMANIPAVGGSLLAHIPRLEGVSRIILYQNKLFNGSGFPNDNVAGADIPLGARVLRVLIRPCRIESQQPRPDADRVPVMRARPGWHDPQILNAVRASLEIVAQNPGEEKKPPTPLPFAALRVGHLLLSDLQTKDGILIVAAGNRITPPR